MILVVALIIFVIGCCLSSYEDNNYNAQREARKRHEELMRVLSESAERDREVMEAQKKQSKVTRRRIAQDKDGNVLAEEITEETV